MASAITMSEKDVRRLWSKIDKHGPIPVAKPELGPCWLIDLKPSSGGYPYFSFGGRKGKRIPAHCIVYELVVGPIPPRHDLDHLCRFHPCVNPLHQEPVTRLENLLRGDTLVARNRAKTHCPYGHPYDEANTRVYKGWRICRACAKTRKRSEYLRERGRV